MYRAMAMARNLLDQALRLQAKAEGRARLALENVVLCQLRGDFTVNLLLMVVVIRHRGMNFGQLEIRMLPANLVGRPAIGQIIGDDHGDSGARVIFQARRGAVFLDDMRISKRGCHDGASTCSIAAAAEGTKFS